MKSYLDLGFDCLDAIVGETDGVCYYYADETSRYYAVSMDDVQALGKMIAEASPPDPYSEWCAASDAEPMPIGWYPGDGHERTLTIFDDVDACGGVWPHIENEPLGDAEDSWEEALCLARARLESAAGECNPADGYSVGDTIVAVVRDYSPSRTAQISHTLTAEDLGVGE